MRTVGVIALCLAALIGGLAVWWKVTYPAFAYRFRMTVEIDVNGDTRSGASVIEVRGKKQPSIGGAPSIAHTIHGEAVFVDLGDGRNVVATLGFGNNASGDLMSSIAPTLFDMSSADVASKLSGSARRAELPEELIPTLITFADVKNPGTARVIAPKAFPEVFGPGVHFKSVRIEMTEEPVTRTIERRLTWLTRMKAEGLGTRIETHPGRLTLNVPYFTRG